MQISEQGQTSYKIINFGKINAVTGSPYYHDVVRPSAGEVVILLNQTVPKGNKIFFDSDFDGIELLPNFPYFIKHNRQIKIRMYDCIRSITSTQTISDASELKILVFDKRENFIQIPQGLTLTDYIVIDSDGSSASRFFINDMLNSKSYRVSLVTSSGNHTHCVECIQFNGFFVSTGFENESHSGYLAVGANAYGDKDSIFVKRLSSMMEVNEIYNEDSVDFKVMCEFLPNLI